MNIDIRGRCCGRKPLKYTRGLTEFFCDRCDRLYDSNGKQKSNFAWQFFDGEWVDVRPKKFVDRPSPQR